MCQLQDGMGRGCGGRRVHVSRWKAEKQGSLKCCMHNTCMFVLPSLRHPFHAHTFHAHPSISVCPARNLNTLYVVLVRIATLVPLIFFVWVSETSFPVPLVISFACRVCIYISS